MARCCSLWLPAVFTLLTAMVELSYCIECTNKNLLKDLPDDMDIPSWCVLDCTKWTYLRKPGNPQNTQMRFTDSEEDALGNHCWPVPSSCHVGDQFERAYVVVPVNESYGAEALNVTLLPHEVTLHLHDNRTVLPGSCGLAYDISALFTRERGAEHLCVQLLYDADTILQVGCHPFLVTQWKTPKHVPTTRKSSNWLDG